MTENVLFTSEDLIDHHAIAAVFHGAGDCVLMLRHAKWGFWTLPIGKAHLDQDPFEGLVEEMQDELGVVVTEATDVKQAELEYVRQSHPLRLVMHIYEVARYSGEITNLEPAKHSEMRYMSVEEVAQLDELSDATLLFLEVKNVQPILARWTSRRIGR